MARSPPSCPSASSSPLIRSTSRGWCMCPELGEDYFQYDNVKHQMLGERSGKRYRLGDRMRVKLVKADLETGRIDFVLPMALAGLAVRLTKAGPGFTRGSSPAGRRDNRCAP